MKSNIALVTVLLAAGLAWLSGISLLMLLAYALALLLAFSYLWVRLNVTSLESQVIRRGQRLHAGQWLDEEITLRNTCVLPKLLIEVQGNADIPGYRSGKVVTLPPKGSCHWTSHTRCLLRGHYIVAPLSVTSEDIFGFFSRRRTLGQPQSLIVYPRIIDLPDFLSVSGDGSKSGKSRFLSCQMLPDISAVRDYCPGDSLRRVHWPSTARNARLMVKDFAGDQFDDVWAVLDMRQEVQAGSGAEGTEEYGATIAASVAKKYLAAGHAVGLITWGDQRYHLPPRKGEQHLQRLLEALAAVKGSGEATPGEIVSTEIESFAANSMVIVITPRPPGPDGWTARLLAQRGVRTVTVLLDAASFSGQKCSEHNNDSGKNGTTFVVRQGDDIAASLSKRTKSRAGRTAGDR